MPVEIALLELFSNLESLPEIAAGFGETVRRSATPERAAGEAEIFSGAEALNAVAADWRAIEREGGLSTPFQSFAVAEAAMPAHLAHGHEPHIIVVREHGEVRAILPLVLTSMAGNRVLRFLGDPLIQYGDVILSRADSEAHLGSALIAAGKLGADAALLRKVRSDARISPLLARRAHVSQVAEAPYVDLRRESGLPPRDARELRRYRRRLAEIGEVKLRITRGGDALDCVQAALELKRNWLSAKGFTSSVIGDPHWQLALVSLVTGHANLLACARLEVGGKLAAIEIAVTHGKRWHAFLGAISPEFAKSGPGQVQMADTIAHAREHGFSAYDLLSPADPFKRVIATGAVAVCDYALPLSLQGQVAARAFRFAPQAKSLLGKLPAPLRSAAKSLLRLP
ncbi:MAG: GNAT family N-acetyltransferase [Xanthobacteraceae bacterium]|nr:GNAT family N-acetyltransferase [Xanthobacteraceae bacterium]